MRFYKLIVLNLLFSLNTSSGQEDIMPINEHFKHYTLKDGLSQVSVNDICKDRQGFLWLATQNGLNRYDGSSFKVYRNDGEIMDFPLGNFVNSVFEDSRGFIWAGTEGNGACYMDPEDEIFRLPEFNISDHNLTANNIAEDASGNIFIAFDNLGVGLVRFINSTIDTCLLLKSNDPIQVTAIDISSDNVLWIGTKDGELYNVDLNLSFTNPTTSKITSISNHHISTIKCKGDGHVWIGTRTQLYIFNRKTNACEKVILGGEDASVAEKPLTIYDIGWDKYEQCWIATGNGLYKLSGNTENPGVYKRCQIFYASSTNPDALSNNTVYCIETDKTNDLVWIGTGKYLNLLVEKSTFKSIASIPGNKQSLNSNVVFSILKDDDRLWIGTSEGGINLIQNKQFYHFTTDQTGLPNNPIFSFTRDQKNHLWVSSKSGIAVLNLNKFEAGNPHFRTIFEDKNDSNALSSNFIRQVYCDRDGNIWACSQLRGLNRFIGDIDKNQIQFQQFRHLPGRLNQLASDRVYCIVQSVNDFYWIGTDAGLSKLTFKDETFNNYDFKEWQIQNHSTGTLSNNTVYCMTEDKEGMLWIGTRNGLNHFNPSSEEFTVYKQSSGLPDNVIYSVVEDENENIWVSTNNGIACFDKSTKQFTCYNESDGLLSNEFNLNANFKDKNGNLYFGSINGVNFFNPNDLGDIDKENKLIFTDFSFNPESGKKLSAKYRNLNKIELNYDDFPFYVTFTDIDIRPYKNVSFAYRLLPDDNSWNLIGKERLIHFPKLAPGNYTIEIQGLSRSKAWTSPPLSLNIVVRPPLWRTKLAYFIYAVLIFMLIYFIYTRRLQIILSRRETERLKEINNLKNKLFADVTHEFRTPLTVILGISNNICTKIEPNNKALIESVLTIERNGEVLLHLVNQMLDLTRLDKSGLKLSPIQTNVIPYLQYIFECFESAAKIKGIEIWFYTEKDEIIMDFDPDQLHKIVSNLLSNAIKQTEDKGRIILHVKHDETADSIVIKVKDTGKGIPEKEQALIFDRFYSAQNSGENTAGMGIGLSLSKELTELMGGTISVSSVYNKGSEFTVTLPITHVASETNQHHRPKIIVPQYHQHKPRTVDYNSSNNQLKKLLILIIEDNMDVSNYIKKCLEQNYDVCRSYDGNEGIEKALTHIPDLIISDIMMPEKSGIELCNFLKNDRRTCHIPIILLTALASDSDKIKGYSAGADAFLTKPFNEDELMVRIDQLTKLRASLQDKYRNGHINSADESMNDKFMRSLLANIGKQLGNNNFKASDLAFALNLSESQLYRKIKALSGRSTALFIRLIRLQNAKEQLLVTEKTVSEIAYQCGFSDPAWFSRSFKEEFGYSPSQFRENGTTSEKKR